MRWWDESMFAVNTYEMMHNGKFFSAYFDGRPDLWNTKPPLTSWCQIIFVKLFGYNELALRLPSAIAAGLSVIFLFLFMVKTFDIIWAWLSILILLTSYGFINFHTARTADSDSLLTFFLLIGNINFLNYFLVNNKRHIFIFFVFISLAFATKLYAALLFSPAYLIILIHQKKLKKFIFNRAFLSGIILFLVSGIGLLYLREMDAPGYLKEVLFKDAGRIYKTVENHNEPPTFYFDLLFNLRFSTWSVLFIIGSLCAFLSKDKTEKNVLLNLFILVSVYLAIISFSVTKLQWYDMPVYPYLSVIAAYPIFLLFKTPSFENRFTYFRSTIFLIAIIFAYPYYIMFNKSQGNTISNGERDNESNERYIFRRSKENTNLDGIKVYYYGHKGSLLFYKYKLAEQNQKIELCNTDTFTINDKVLVCNDSLIYMLNNKFKFSVIDTYGKAQLLRINNRLNK